MYEITYDQSQRLFHALENLHSACEYWENQDDPVLKDAKEILDEVRGQKLQDKKPKFCHGDVVILEPPPDYEGESPWPFPKCNIEAIDVHPTTPGMYYRLSLIGIDNYTYTAPESRLTKNLSLT